MPQILNKVVRWIVAPMTAALLFFPLVSLPQTAEQTPYDIVVINGHILDGTGSPWYEGSLAIRNGKIADIGRIGDVAARRTIDAKGMVVAPGFIDLHSHSDFTLLVDGKAGSKIRQGVTTEIIGESLSAGPVLGPAVAQSDRDLAIMAHGQKTRMD